MTPAAGRAGTIVSVNTSVKKGQIKSPVASVELYAGRGIDGYAHKDFGHRQISLWPSRRSRRRTSRRRAGRPSGPGASPRT
jgi:hypothetical protein